MQITAKTA